MGCLASVGTAGTRKGSSKHRPDPFPALVTWHMLGVKIYVTAIEPANCPTIEGRTAARGRGTRPFLEPDETHEYELEFDVRTL